MLHPALPKCSDSNAIPFLPYQAVVPYTCENPYARHKTCRLLHQNLCQLQHANSFPQKDN